MHNDITQIAHDKCTGCGACANCCPHDAITMELDKEGFIFPSIDEKLCINCGKCFKVCPVTTPLAHHETPKSYAVWANDEIRKESSSGGMFTLLANYVFAQGGVVFGARYSEDYLTVYHASARNPQELIPLKKSKYVQSDTRLTYREAKQALEKNLMVLYTGCPCQIAGLYNYLGKSYDNLITADIVCHSANSVTAYQSFVREFSEQKPIKKVDFRDKVFFNWSTPTVVYLQDGTVRKAAWDQGTWYKGFLQGIINRECCYSCEYARAERISDITLADAWQVYRIDPRLDDRKGTSLVLANSVRGKEIFKKIRNSMSLCEGVPLDELRKYNGQLNAPTPKPRDRNIFFAQLEKYGYHRALQYSRAERFDVALVGWWFASNYGSTLTYYALGSILKQKGLQPLLVPIPKLDGNPWEPATQQSVQFLSKYFAIGENRPVERMHELNAFCDCFMLGSDQLWTAASTRQLGYTFFLDFVDKDKKKIAFSTSFGHADFGADEKMLATARDYLNRFDAVSVRESSGVELCKRAFGIEAQHIIDPVFLCNRCDYDNMIANVVPKIDMTKKYLLCYILDPKPSQEILATKIAQHENLEIVTMFGLKEYEGNKNKWHTGYILPKMTSEEFVYYIKNCSYLLTDSHHGTCFGIIYQKQYLALVNTQRGATRFESVASALGLKQRLKYEDQPFRDEEAYIPIDYRAVTNRLDLEKSKAFSWLDDALSKPTKIGVDTPNTLAADNERKSYALYAQTRELRNEVNQLRKDFARLENLVQKTKAGHENVFITRFKKLKNSLKKRGFVATVKLCWSKLLNKLFRKRSV